MQRTSPQLLLITAMASLLLGCGRPPAPATPAGDQYRLWQDSSIFTAVTSLLSTAARGEPVWVEMYEFGRPDLASALQSARDRGADVRVIVDRTVRQSARTADTLSKAGLAVRAYPVDDRRHQIDHVKLLISAQAAVVGGMNWGSHSSVNHDYAFETRRPDVLQRLRSIFEQDWSLAGGRPAPVRAQSGPVAQTAPGEEVRALLVAAIRQSTRSVWAEVFVLTDPEVLAALGGAHRRGVTVRILLDPAQDPNLSSFRLLKAAGVEVRWYPVPPGAKLHAKAGLFDGHKLLLGSANWSLSGLSVNHELDLVAEDRVAAAAFAARFERDWSASA
jgi:phosphatidylserine/phosphatidylglycerophosphate/cardiolipin synthase-like enzyme